MSPTEKECFAIFNQGVAAWNKWREENPDLEPEILFFAPKIDDLSGIDFSNMYLEQSGLPNKKLLNADFTNSSLIEIKMSESDLRGADLRWSDLRGADLSKSSFVNANLSGVDLRPWKQMVGVEWGEKELTYNTDLTNTDFTGANLSEVDLSEVDLRGACVKQANLSNATLNQANLSELDLREVNCNGASFGNANLIGANFNGADLRGVNLTGANLRNATFVNALLEGADLSGAFLAETDFTGANLNRCRIYGIAAWDVLLEGAEQKDLIITKKGYPEVTVDNLEMAQFIYILLNNQRIHHVINTIVSKVVLILGRFTPERKKVLNALREELRKQNYSPVVFDFEISKYRDLTEIARTLAHLSRFIIADITEPSSIPQELQAIVPDLEVPVQPLLEEGKWHYSMFPDLKKYGWVLPIYRYKDQKSLIDSLEQEVIRPANNKFNELALLKAKRLKNIP